MPALSGDFTVPARPADLESAASAAWKVSSKVDTSTNPVDLLLAAAESVRQDAMALATSEIFDLAYASLKAYNSLPADACAALAKFVGDALQHVAKACKRAVSSSAPDSELAQCRSVLKAAVYLQVWLLQDAEKANATRQEAAVAIKPAKGAKGAKKGKAADRDEAFDWASRDWAF